MNAKMSLPEKIVVGLTVAVLIAGFASGVFADPTGVSSYSSSLVTVHTPSSPGR